MTMVIFTPSGEHYSFTYSDATREFTLYDCELADWLEVIFQGSLKELAELLEKCGATRKETKDSDSN